MTITCRLATCMNKAEKNDGYCAEHRDHDPAKVPVKKQKEYINCVGGGGPQKEYINCVGGS